MKYLKLTLLTALISAQLVTPTVRAEDSNRPWTLDTEVAFNSAYMFRGQNLYDGASIQPYIKGDYDIGYGKLGGSGWAHISADGATNVQEFFEIDWGLWYEVSFDPLTVSVGHLWYTYPNDNDDINSTREWYVSLALDDSSFNSFYTLNPTLTMSYDVQEIDYDYYELKLSHEYADGIIGKGNTLTPYATFGFVANGDKVYEDNGLVQVTTGVSASLPMGDISVTPSLNYTFGIDDNANDQFWFGVAFGYSL